MQFIINNKLCKTSKLRIIGKGSTNGININRFNKEALDEKIISKIKTQLNFSNHKKYLLCIGRLVKDKGIVELVHVFNQLQKSDNNLILILVEPLPIILSLDVLQSLLSMMNCSKELLLGQT